MAADIPVYGIDRELEEKKNARYDANREQEVRGWIETVLGEKLSAGSFADALKDGHVLCKLIKQVHGADVKPNNGKMPFQKMENIGKFLDEASRLGVPKHDLFQTVDLFEEKNIPRVIDSVYAFARHAASLGREVPLIGPKLAEKQPALNLPLDKVIEGKKVISLQYGVNTGVNQSGMVFGGIREIDHKVSPGASIPSMQTHGYTEGANQSGMVFGGIREIDHKVSPGASIPSMQTHGYTEGANQSGMSYGARRQIKDDKIGESASPSVPVQHVAGYNEGDNQSGIIYGLPRQIVPPK